MCEHKQHFHVFLSLFPRIFITWKINCDKFRMKFKWSTNLISWINWNSTVCLLRSLKYTVVSGTSALKVEALLRDIAVIPVPPEYFSQGLFLSSSFPPRSRPSVHRSNLFRQIRCQPFSFINKLRYLSLIYEYYSNWYFINIQSQTNH